MARVVAHPEAPVPQVMMASQEIAVALVVLLSTVAALGVTGHSLPVAHRMVPLLPLGQVAVVVAVLTIRMVPDQGPQGQRGK